MALGFSSLFQPSDGFFGHSTGAWHSRDDLQADQVTEGGWQETRECQALQECVIEERLGMFETCLVGILSCYPLKDL